MKHHQNKIVGEALTYDDVLLVPAYSKILPKDVEIKSPNQSFKFRALYMESYYRSKPDVRFVLLNF